MAEQLVFLSNDAVGTTPARVYLRDTIVGNITADSAGRVILGVAPKAGTITNIWGANGENGADGTDALSIAYVVKKNGTTVSSTEAGLAKAAGTGRKTTYAAGTGVTQAVLKTDGTARFAAGDSLTVDFDITRTTPETEIANPSVVVEIVLDATAPV